jgi:HEAT repeat protein
MLLTPALFALMIGTQATQVPQGTISVGGKQIALRLTQSKPVEIPEGYLDWSGFGFLGGSKGVAFQPYVTVDDWTSVAKLRDTAPATGAVPWRARIVVFTRIQQVGKNPEGITLVNRDTLSDTELQGVLESIARATAIINAEFAGQIDFQPEVTVERDPISSSAEDGLGAEFATRYFAPRINGGAYEAEDKVFRGPFQSGFYVVPGYSIVPLPLTRVNDTPIQGLSLGHLPSRGDAADWQFNPGSLEQEFRVGLRAQMQARLRAQGFATPTDQNDPTAGGAQAAAMLDEPTAEILIPRLSQKAALAPVGSPNFVMPLVPTWQAAGMDAAVVDDSTAGKVLKITEKASARSGGIALPVPAGNAPLADLDTTGTLSFSARSISKDPIAVRVVGSNGASFWLSLGYDLPLATPNKVVVAQVPFEHDGQWHSVAVDLKPFASVAGFTSVKGLCIEPTPNALSAEPLEVGTGEYFFNSFKFSADAGQALLPPLTASFTSPEPLARAMAAAQATSSSPELIALLKDESAQARVNASEAFLRFKDPTAEEALGVAAGDFAMAVESNAIQALGMLGTDTALAKVRQTLRFSLSEPGRAAAAKVLGKTGENKYSGDILLLFTSPSWQTRIAALDAISLLPTVDSKFRIGFLRNEDPAVRVHVLELADLKSPDYLSAIAWHAVNDASDLVRATAYTKLIETKDPKYVPQGLKGVRDDSVYVRKVVLDYIAKHPDESAKPALLQGVADRSPGVRAAALHALATYPGTVTSEEIANTLSDQQPAVQIALVQLAKAKGIALTPATLDQIKSSPDPAVAKAAAENGF